MVRGCGTSLSPVFDKDRRRQTIGFAIAISSCWSTAASPDVMLDLVREGTDPLRHDDNCLGQIRGRHAREDGTVPIYEVGVESEPPAGA